MLFLRSSEDLPPAFLTSPKTAGKSTDESDRCRHTVLISTSVVMDYYLSRISVTVARLEAFFHRQVVSARSSSSMWPLSWRRRR